MKNIKYIFLLVLAVLFFNRCEDDIAGTEDINYISFEVNTPVIIVEQGSSTQIEIKVYTTQKSGSDRSFNVEIIEDNTTANAESYDIPSTVTVPANSNVGTINVVAKDDNLGQDPVSIGLRIQSGEVLFTGNEANLTIQKHCTLDINDFVGTYSGQTLGGWGPTQVVTSLDNSGNLYISGVGVSFLTGYWGEVIQSMETLPVNVDLESGDFTIDQAPYVVTTYNGEVQATYYLSAYGNLNACSGTMYLYYDFYQDGFGSYVEWAGDQAYFTEIIRIE